MIFSIHIISSYCQRLISVCSTFFLLSFEQRLPFSSLLFPLQNLVCCIDRCVCHLFGRLCCCSCHHTFFDQFLSFWRSINSVYENTFSSPLLSRAAKDPIAAGSFNPMTTSIFLYFSMILSTLGSARSICP